jgi:hypothetical protein
MSLLDRTVRVVLAAAGVAVLVAVFVVGRLIVLGPDRHQDGDGPLSSLPKGTSIGNALDPTASGRATFGLELCLLEGGDVATIESVGPTLEVGTGAKFLGALARTFDVEVGAESDHEPIGSVDGFPPSPSYAPDNLSEAVGYPVQVRCHRDGPPVTYTELLLGFERAGATGGGWRGIDVGYVFEGRHRTVSLSYRLCFAGTTVDTDCQARSVP